LISSLSTSLSSAQSTSKKRVQHLKTSDLPTFKGDSLDGGDAETFVNVVSNLFKNEHSSSPTPQTRTK
jgi:hypothetical protein